MKKILLLCLMVGWMFYANAQSKLELRIIKTGQDGGVDISADDGEFENLDLDKLNDDDLDMGWEGDDLNVMTTFTRFQNVTIPQGATIDSAFIYVWAHEDENDEAKVTIFAEDIDDSPIFVETEKLYDRTWTNDSFKWTISEPWTMWEGYRSPNFKNVVQAVIDRPGWESGNSLTLFFRGENQGANQLDNARDFESFENIEDPADGGDGKHHPERIPMLQVYYSVKSTTVTYRIQKTGEDGGIDISADDGEFENNDLDKLNDDDLDMGWEGDDLNMMTAYTRFRDINIPQGAIIEEAYIKVWAHEDEKDEARITVFAEDIDNSPEFTETEKLNSRTWTQDSVKWTITEEWIMWRGYLSVDLKDVIQPIINRPGWKSGNALTLFFRGENQGANQLDNARDFESFENIEDPSDGGDGKHHPERIPKLIITYNVGGSSISETITPELYVYPNPSETGFFNIAFETPEKADIYVFDMQGQMVFRGVSDTKLYTMDLSKLKAGVYAVRAIQDERSYVQKIIIK